MHSGRFRVVAGKPLDPALTTENVEAVRAGAANLAKHIEIVRAYGVPVVVAMNAFPTDTPAEFAAIREVSLDVEEGADIIMVKPALPYLDVIAAARAQMLLPVALNRVSVGASVPTSVLSTAIWPPVCAR